MLKKYFQKIRGTNLFQLFQSPVETSIYDLNYIDLLDSKKIANYLKNATFFKNTDGDTTTVAYVEVGNKKIVIKRYNQKSFFHFLKLQFRESHAFRSFWYAYYLNKLNIQTIKPIAAIQKKYFFFKKEAYFISEYLDGIKGCYYFKDNSEYQEHWPTTIKAIQTLYSKMKSHFIYHGDFHFGNLVIVADKTYILDFDRIHQFKSPRKFLKSTKKDLQNFHRYVARHAQAAPLFQGKLL